MVDTAMTALFAVKDALYTISETLYLNENVRLSYGNPGLDISLPDCICFLDGTADQEMATMTATRRTRTETGTVQVLFFSFAEGEADDDRVPANRAAYLLGILEKYTRQSPTYGGDTTLGGVCLWSALTNITTTGATDDAVLGGGRQIQLTATFSYYARITS